LCEFYLQKKERKSFSNFIQLESSRQIASYFQILKAIMNFY